MFPSNFYRQKPMANVKDIPIQGKGVCRLAEAKGLSLYRDILFYICRRRLSFVYEAPVNYGGIDLGIYDLITGDSKYILAEHYHIGIIAGLDAAFDIFLTSNFNISK